MSDDDEGFDKEAMVFVCEYNAWRLIDVLISTGADFNLRHKNGIPEIKVSSRADHYKIYNAWKDICISNGSMFSNDAIRERRKKNER
jgi:hypothetical protein|tara:strand:- start:14 stop:274 length:261 start_codon:yes stop_codon:yes gene_type:complete